MRKIFCLAVLMLLLSAVNFAQAPQEKFATVFGAKIRYLETGDAAKPTVVLVHGMGSNADSWVFNAPALAAKYRVIALDQIGFGKSDKPMLKYRVGTFVDFLDRFLAELKIDKARIVGISLGGWVSALYAAKYPAKVEKLVLIDAAGFAPPKDFDWSKVYALNSSTRDEVRQNIKAVFYNQTLFGTEAMVETFLTQRVAAGDGHTIASLIESLKRGEDYIDDKLSAVTQPTLVVWGKQDGLIPVTDGERYHKGINGSELVVFDQAGHAPNVEKAADFNKKVLEFLDK
jgi:2-hydroxy-6-oxonona-2,4-dienedioate hydrolase